MLFPSWSRRQLILAHVALVVIGVAVAVAIGLSSLSLAYVLIDIVVIAIPGGLLAYAIAQRREPR